MIALYVFIALAGILTVAEIILNFATIWAFFKVASERWSEGDYVTGIFMVLIAVVGIIALLSPAIKELKNNRTDKGD